MQITLKAARVNVRLTQDAAAERLGISPDSLSNYERGISFPSVPVIQAIERVYGVKYDDLIFCPKITV